MRLGVVLRASVALVTLAALAPASTQAAGANTRFAGSFNWLYGQFADTSSGHTTHSNLASSFGGGAWAEMPIAGKWTFDVGVTYAQHRQNAAGGTIT
jgi:hypothetical protein